MVIPSIERERASLAPLIYSSFFTEKESIDIFTDDSQSFSISILSDDKPGKSIPFVSKDDFIPNLYAY